MTVNHASRHVLDKAGLLLVKTIVPNYPTPIPGAEYGEVHYEIRKS